MNEHLNLGDKKRMVMWEGKKPKNRARAGNYPVSASTGTPPFLNTPLTENIP